jgi:hypothetical protein
MKAGNSSTDVLVTISAPPAPQRVAALPDVQTMIEAGFPELTLRPWQGMYVLQER